MLLMLHVCMDSSSYQYALVICIYSSIDALQYKLHVALPENKAAYTACTVCVAFIYI